MKQKRGIGRREHNCFQGGGGKVCAPAEQADSRIKGPVTRDVELRVQADNRIGIRCIDGIRAPHKRCAGCEIIGY